MEEKYLHYIWKSKRFNSRGLKLVDGREVEVLNVGWHNHDAGPDFFNGTVKIDGITWTGNIELHVRSSDWYAHKHQHDPAYENVVLHVVLDYDKDVLVKERTLPTLELNNLIDLRHYENYRGLIHSNNEKPCAHVLTGCKEALKEQVQLSFFHRIERKGLEILNEAESRNLNQYDVLMYCFAQAFGGRLNKQPMQELVAGLPIKLIWKENWNKTRVSALIFGIAGFLKDSTTEYQSELQREWGLLKRKYNLAEMRNSSWKFKGVRPHSFPPRKLAEFSSLIVKLVPEQLKFDDADMIRKYTDHLFDVELNQFWKNHVSFNKTTEKQFNLSLSKSTKDKLLINAIAPYLIYRKHVFGERQNDEIILELFEGIPFERNHVTKQWLKLGVSCENALESQGLLELNNEFCIFRKCLSCQVGKSILER